MPPVPPLQSWGFGPSFGTSFTATSTNAVVSGSLVVVHVFVKAGTAPGSVSVSDSSSPFNYQVDVETPLNPDGYIGVFSSKIVTSPGLLTVLVNIPGNTGSARIFISEYARALPTWFDAASVGLASGTQGTNSVSALGGPGEIVVSDALWTTSGSGPWTPRISSTSPLVSFTVEDVTPGIVHHVQDVSSVSAPSLSVTVDLLPGQTATSVIFLLASYRVDVSQNASVSLPGVATTTVVNIGSGKGTGNVPVSGLTAPAALGAVDSKGTAIFSASGVTSTTALGAVAPAGPANVAASGVTFTTALGAVASKGSGITGLLGVSITSAIGLVSTISGANATANILGVSFLSSASSLFPSAAANAALSGCSASAAAGTVTASILIQAFAIGVGSTAQLGAVLSNGTANVFLSGVHAGSALGTVVAASSVDGTVVLSSVQFTSTLGTVGTSLSAYAFVVGVGSLCQFGSTTESGTASVFLLGVEMLAIANLPIGSTPARAVGAVIPTASAAAVAFTTANARSLVN